MMVNNVHQYQPKLTIPSHLKSLNIKKTMTYDAENPGSGLGQAHKCGRVKPVNGIPTAFDNWISNGNTDILSVLFTLTKCILSFPNFSYLTH